MPIKRLENLLNSSNDAGLGEIIRHARDMGELLDSLRSSLAADQGDNIIAANVRDDGELVVLASSSAWASRLRFETEALMQAARNAGVDVSTCSVRVSRGASDSGQGASRRK